MNKRPTHVSHSFPKLHTNSNASYTKEGSTQLSNLLQSLKISSALKIRPMHLLLKKRESININAHVQIKPFTLAKQHELSAHVGRNTAGQFRENNGAIRESHNITSTAHNLTKKTSNLYKQCKGKINAGLVTI